LDPAAIAALIAQLVQAENDVLLLKYVAVASVVLVAYDIILTLPAEIELIWKSRFSRGTVLYFVVRYVNTVQMALDLIYYLWVDPPFKFCQVYFYFDAYTSTFCVIPITVVLAFRTYAVCDRNVLAKRLLWILTVGSNVAVVAAVIWTTVEIKIVPPSIPVPGFTCVLSASGVPRNAGILQYVAGVSFDFGIFLITAARLYKLYVFGRTQLIKVIMRDCLWYFMALTWLNLAQLFIFIFIPPSRLTISAVFVNLSRSLAVIFTSRIVLNLRGFVSRPDADVTVNTLTTPPGVYMSDYSMGTGASSTVHSGRGVHNFGKGAKALVGKWSTGSATEDF